ncbi:MAG: hypothetical protein KDA37_08095, partial [Planctomycetales bacterium]|nr:hypothetical protein [Planctomycetales bacterium]
AVATGCLAAYVLFLALPFYLDGGKQYSAEFPDTALGHLTSLGGALTLLLGPVVAVGALLWSFRAFMSAATTLMRLHLLLAGLIAVVPLPWLASPVGSDAVQWWLD